MSVSSFGRWLEVQIERRDLNWSGLAALLRVNHASVFAWKTGKTEPSRNNIRRLATTLHVPIEQVYAALGRIPSDQDMPEDIQQIAEILREITVADREIVANLVRPLVGRGRRAESRAGDIEAESTTEG